MDVLFNRKDHLINKETGQYDAEEFLKHPDRYTSTFKTKVSYLNKYFIYKIIFPLNINLYRTIHLGLKKSIIHC